MVFVMTIWWHLRVWHDTRWHHAGLNLVKRYPASNSCDCHMVGGYMIQCIYLPCLHRMNLKHIVLMQYLSRPSLPTVQTVGRAISIICLSQWDGWLDLHRSKRSNLPRLYVPFLLDCITSHQSHLWRLKHYDILLLLDKFILNRMTCTITLLISMLIFSFIPINYWLRMTCSKMLNDSVLNFVQTFNPLLFCVLWIWTHRFGLPHQFPLTR